MEQGVKDESGGLYWTSEPRERRAMLSLADWSSGRCNDGGAEGRGVDGDCRGLCDDRVR
jgi:hypothetical protein